EPHRAVARPRAHPDPDGHGIFRGRDDPGGLSELRADPGLSLRAHARSTRGRPPCPDGAAFRERATRSGLPRARRDPAGDRGGTALHSRDAGRAPATDMIGSSFVLRALRIPPEPQPPAGAPGSLRVFRAAPAFYRLRLIQWGFRQLSP